MARRRPVLSALLTPEKIRAVLAFHGVHFGFSLGVPVPVTDLWGFVSAPSGDGVHVAGPDSLAGLVGVGVGVLLVAVLTAPYLVVLDDVGFVAALGRSLALTTESSAYARFFAGYAGATLAVSIPATVVVVNLGIVGLLLGGVALSYLGLVFDAATLGFVADVTSPTAASAPDDAGDPA